MKHNTLSPELTVTQLAQRTYSASELVLAAGITGDTLTNYLSKAKINLCSESEGRGKSRKYNLLDIYSISIMSALIKLSDNQVWAARTLEYLLFLPDFPVSLQSNPLSFDGPGAAKIRLKLSSDIKAANPIFWQRNWHSRPWLLFADRAECEGNLFGCKLVKVGNENSFEGSLDVMANSHDGFYLNVTWLLLQVDKRLCELIAEYSA